MEKQPAVYILTNHYLGTLYIGVTSNLIQRIWQHKQGGIEGFSKRYGLKKLVYFEVADSMYSAISREKQLKSGSRQKKIQLIESMNKEWLDLYPNIQS
jgi:putative endonuclease